MLLTDELTDKEKQVLRMLARGKKPKDIAAVYGVSDNTARYWMDNICKKVKAETILQAFGIALNAGVIE